MSCIFGTVDQKEGAVLSPKYNRCFPQQAILRLISAYGAWLILTGGHVGSAFAQMPEIRHAAVSCMGRTEFPLLTAVINPRNQIRTARVFFRSSAYPDFYYVDLTDLGNAFQAILPKASPETARVIYYIEAVDRTFNSARTPESNAEVMQDSDECQRRDPKAASFNGNNPGIAVGSTTAGSPGIPPGFAADGIVRFISVAGVASGGGGGIGTGAVVAFSVGAAAAAGVGVLGLREETSTSTTSIITNTTTVVSTTTTTGPRASVKACFQTTPDPPVMKIGEPITLDGRCSAPQDVVYAWDLGDGGSKDQAFIQYVYRVAGKYNARLTVRSGTVEDTTSRQITVDPPTTTTPPTSTTTIPLPTADLEVAKKSLPQSVSLGDGFEYQVDVANNGPDTASAVVLTDDVPDGLDIRGIQTSGSVTCSQSGRSVTCNASLSAKQSFRAHIFVTAQKTGSFTNRARVSGNVNDPSSFNNSASATTDVISRANLSVKIVDAPDPVAPGAELTYTVTVSNGKTGASNVTLDGELDGKTLFSFFKIKDAEVNCSQAGRNRVKCARAKMPADKSFEVDIVVKVDPDATVKDVLTSAVSVSASEIDTDPSDNDDKAETSVFVLFSREAALESHFTSLLDAGSGTEAAAGNVLLNGAQLDGTTGGAPFRHNVKGRGGENTIEAYTFSPIQGDGVWEFRFSDSPHFVAGSIRVSSGRLVSLDGLSVVFALNRTPGERIKFSYELRP